MSSQGSLFLSRYRLKDVLGGDGDRNGGDNNSGGDSCDDGGSTAKQRGTKTNHLTGPGITSDHNAIPPLTPDSHSSLMSMISDRLDHLQSTMTTRLNHVTSTNINTINTHTNSNHSDSLLSAVSAQQTIILERLDRMEATIQSQQDLLVRLELTVSRLANR